MIRGLSLIHHDVSTVNFDPMSPKWKALDSEIQQATRFWFEIRGVIGTRSNENGSLHWLDNLKNYFETDSLTFSDALLIRPILQKLLEISDNFYDVDEGVRILKDFLQLEEGKRPSRTIDLAVSRFIAYPEKVTISTEYDEPFEEIVMDPDFGHHWSVLYYLDIKQQIGSLETWRSVFPEGVPDSAVENLRACLLPYFQVELPYFDEGLNEAIGSAIQFVSSRNYRELRLRGFLDNNAGANGVCEAFEPALAS